MFGYIVVNQDELKIKEYNMYHAYYCGLCQSLKTNFGRRGQLSLNYDMTFLTLLLTALYEPEEKYFKVKCMAHPMTYHQVVQNKYTDYAAAMNILLAYYKSMDDWQDERRIRGACYSRMLKRSVTVLEKKYPRQAKIMSEYLGKIREAELAGEERIDVMAGYFGRIMQEIFIYREDEWQEELSTLGFYLGKFIYILDAFDDVEKDMKNNSYNPFIKVYEASFFERWVKQLLLVCAENMARSIEILPIIEHENILKNIIYSGIWKKYQIAVNRRNGEKERED